MAKSFPKPLSRYFQLLVFIGAATLSHRAEALRFYDFESQADAFSCFRKTYAEPRSYSKFEWAAGELRHTASYSGSIAFIYDTEPIFSSYDTFKSVAVEFDFKTTTSNISVGVFFGGHENTPYHLAIFNLDTNTAGNDTIRFFSGCDAIQNKLGPQVGETSELTSGAWSPHSVYHVLMEVSYTSPTTADATFSITDPTNRISPFSKTITGITVAAEGAGISFRSNFSGGGEMANTFDNISITPVQ